jgi:hypothetical protein
VSATVPRGSIEPGSESSLPRSNSALPIAERERWRLTGPAIGLTLDAGPLILGGIPGGLSEPATDIHIDCPR